jgi:hypothetical protein
MAKSRKLNAPILAAIPVQLIALAGQAPLR